MEVLRIAGRFRSRGSTVVRLDRRLDPGLLFSRRPAPMPAPVVGVRPVGVVFLLTWLIRHDDSSLAEGRRLLPPKVSESVPQPKRPETPPGPAASCPCRVAGVTMQRYAVTSATARARTPPITGA
jgi:hypothetical protein